MEEGKARLKILLEKWFNGHISVQEEQELAGIVKDNTYKEVIAEKFENLWDNMPDAGYNEGPEAKHLADRILQNNPAEKSVPVAAVKRVHVLKAAWLRYAAVVILVVGVGVYNWFQNSREQVSVSKNNHSQQELDPGKDGAILTLADGTQIVLDSLGNGVVTTQNGSQVVLKDGQLVYDPTGKSAEKLAYNSVRTPKGRQFNLRLSDGTQVWLNAGSTLRYPIRFSEMNRVVEVTGEAYFEVAHNAKQPFLVKIDNHAEVLVLGTKFNVDAYKDNASINTTLIEGSVRISNGVSYDKEQAEQKARREKSSVVLKPGQQAVTPVVESSDQLASSSPLIRGVSDADINKIMAWKRGYFSFQNASLHEVMKQLERWYDIEVVYEKDIPDIRFMGEISRKAKLSGVLKGLEEMGVHFRMEDGRRLYINKPD